MAGCKRLTAWNKDLDKRHSEYEETLAEMSSLKTASYTNAEWPFLKWKFFRQRMAPVAVDAIAKRILLTVSMESSVAYGNWSKRDGINRHASSPVKGLAGVLRKCATVAFMDKFMTSKLCLQCRQTLSTVNYIIDIKLPKRRKRKDVVLPRSRAETQLEEKQCYEVLRWDHAECTTKYWDRDVNAAINMVNLLKSEVQGHSRMGSFRR